MGSVIKEKDVPDRRVQSVSADEPLSRPASRIPKRNVQAPSSDEENASPSPSEGTVLPEEQVRRTTEPYSIETAELEPDFPLPNAPSDSKETAAKEDGEKEETPPDIDALKEQWEAEWQERLDKAVAEAREEGYETGYAEAQDELKDDVESTKIALQADVARLQACWTNFFDEAKPLLAELAVDIAEHLLNAELPPQVKGASGPAIAQAVEELAGDGSITISLHPVDYLRLQETGLTEQIDATHPDLHWDTDADLDEGDWQVQSPEAMIRRLRTEVVEELKRHLQLTD